MVGQTISHYRVVAQLGAGGMGVVYRAEDVRLGRSVALKFVSEDLADDPHAIERLRSEARAASALNHANICTIYDIGEHQGHPFLVMELMKGRTLRDVLAAGALKVHQLVDIGIETADALHAAHSEGIIHRDIKPGNLFVTERGHVKILDFGLAKLTQLSVPTGTTRNMVERTAGGVTLGTVSYMSPEQATGEELDNRTDLFSLGVVLYECATGQHPFPGKTSAVILSSILNRAPVAPIVLNPELPLRLQDVINNCLEKDRELRYQSAADLRADLKRVRRDIESGQSRAVEAASSRVRSASGSGSRSSPAPVPPPSGTRVLRIAGGAAIVALVAGGAYMISRSDPPRPAEPPPPAPATAPAPDPEIPSRLALANASFEARDYRAALAYAGQVLAIDPSHAAAARIRDQSRAMLEKLDAAIAEARRRLAAGDVQGASRALEAARSIDAGAPGVTEIASRLVLQARQREREPASEATRGAGTQPPARRETPPASQAPPTPAPTAAPAVPPREEPPPSGPPPSSNAAPPPAQVAPPAPQPTAPAKPAPAPAEPPARVQPAPAAPPPEAEEAAIRRAIVTYARAIERKDLALFRSVKPNLSADEERRLEAGFRAVTSQRVDLTILSIDRRGDEASVALRRRDTIQAGGRQHTAESQQTMTLARTGDGWKIVDIR